MKSLPKTINYYLFTAGLLLLSLFLFIPAFLEASTETGSGDSTPTAEHQEYLPVILKLDGTPVGTNTPTSSPTPSLTPVPGMTPTHTPTATVPCPFNPTNIPANGSAKIQAEDFMCGGQGVAYNDVNTGGDAICADYRTDESTSGVDLKDSGDDGTCSIGWTANGEWVRYEVNVATLQAYYFTLRIASPVNGRLRIKVTNQYGSTQTSILDLPNTGSDSTWANYIVPESLYLDSGSTNIVEIRTEWGGYNLNYFTIETTPPPTPEPGGILFVVGNTSLNGGDSAIRDHLQNNGHDVTIVDDSAATAGDATDKELVIISSTVSSTQVGVKFRDVTTPVMIWEVALYDEMDMAGSGTSGTDTNETEIYIRDSSHPLAAGFANGLVTVVDSNETFSFAEPNNDAAKVATIDNNTDNHTIFGFETGSTMENDTVAPARRVGFFLTENTATQLNDNGWQLFDAAINWALGDSISTSCDVQFAGFAIANTSQVYVTGDIGSTVTITDLTTGNTLGSDVLQSAAGHACPGFTDFASSPLNELLQVDHLLLAESSDSSSDTIVVGPAIPIVPTAGITPSPTLTATPIPSSTPTNTPTTFPTATRRNPYIILNPDCGGGGGALTVSVSILGFNWDNNEAIGLFWNGSGITLIDAGHGGSFSIATNNNVTDGTYEVRAESSGTGAEKDIDTKTFTVPCDDFEIPTATPTPTSTPIPADLTTGKPQLISTPPIVAHTPLQFSVSITNSGQVDINQQFFVDIFLDPQNIHADHIPLAESSGYFAISSLAGGQSKQLTITAPLGIDDSPGTHVVYAMVDSVQQIAELLETNNISSAAMASGDTTDPPTATPTPGGSEQISGVVSTLTNDLRPQHRAIVKLSHPTLGVIAVEETDMNGAYIFYNIPPLNNPARYILTACFQSDSNSYFGTRNNIQAPFAYANIYLISGPCS